MMMFNIDTEDLDQEGYADLDIEALDEEKIPLMVYREREKISHLHDYFSGCSCEISCGKGMKSSRTF